MNDMPYSLRNGQENSDTYYSDVAAFTDIVLAKASESVGDLAEDFRTYLLATQRESLRTEAEYMIELLTLGIFWRVHITQAENLPQAPRRCLAGLAALRRHHGFLRKGIDFLRGILRGFFIRSKELGNPQFDADMEKMDCLLNWLTTTEDFYYEEKRLRPWRDFLATRPLQSVSSDLDRVLDLAAWFESESGKFLGCYTQNVDAFLAQFSPTRRLREDYLFVSRQPVEYHLNMVGAEIMNRAFREAFLRPSRKTVLLPACMPNPARGQCLAQYSDSGYQCKGCSPECRVNHLTTLGERQNFTVFVIPHKSTLFQLQVLEGDKKPGVVGVACVTTLLSGGWMLKGQDIPAQCVLLDHCGCKNHWHKEGIATDINVDYLMGVLGIGNNDEQVCDLIAEPLLKPVTNL